MRYLPFFLLFATFISNGQVLETKPILEPINDLFTGMEKGDTALVHSAFFEDAILATVIEKDGKVNVQREILKPFLIAIASPKKIQWHEPIWDVRINQDGNFAQVWASYAFYLGTNFSHCGIDTFQLIKTVAGWKIFYLADTRKKIGCEVPEEITKQYSK